ncbi:hypothetical protein ACIOHS_02065 [Streptomyces sp. NPDC088253]|uniref:hypothetical protein n=1 Tax=Streptomyces sp. NPDC088253 TaxID=3365846 RepID=UPI0037FDC2BB
MFFSGDKRLCFGGTIALRWRNKALATRLWGTDSAGNTRECIHALPGTRGFDIPIAEIRTLLGWNPNLTQEGTPLASNPRQIHQS